MCIPRLIYWVLGESDMNPEEIPHIAQVQKGFSRGKSTTNKSKPAYSSLTEEMRC